jgi:hypothetical protein
VRQRTESKPSPSGKYASFPDYVAHCVALAGTASNLGAHLGFSSGTRVADWRKGVGGRPSELACAKLAKFSGDPVLDVLGMGGHDELVELLRTEALGHEESGIGLAGIRPGDLGRMRLMTALDAVEEQVSSCRRLLQRI